jgi:hypothetical protein
MDENDGHVKSLLILSGAKSNITHDDRDALVEWCKHVTEDLEDALVMGLIEGIKLGDMRDALCVKAMKACDAERAKTEL